MAREKHQKEDGFLRRIDKRYCGGFIIEEERLIEIAAPRKTIDTGGVTWMMDNNILKNTGFLKILDYLGG